ncbi:unnamed protein product [Nezara viridula]|uniref:Uncharacterized protein n=1 Tax=Nezara viridula TaxID=85310 RepID=A0A9P0EDC4_NEZVI|nr:unnamed protein product [Nezara viridula]
MNMARKIYSEQELLELSRGVSKSEAEFSSDEDEDSEYLSQNIGETLGTSGMSSAKMINGRTEKIFSTRDTSGAKLSCTTLSSNH